MKGTKNRGKSVTESDYLYLEAKQFKAARYFMHFRKYAQFLVCCRRKICTAVITQVSITSSLLFLCPFFLYKCMSTPLKQPLRSSCFDSEIFEPPIKLEMQPIFRSFYLSAVVIEFVFDQDTPKWVSCTGVHLSVSFYWAVSIHPSGVTVNTRPTLWPVCFFYCLHTIYSPFSSSPCHLGM